jgi:hypothetical protein
VWVVKTLFLWRLPLCRLSDLLLLNPGLTKEPVLWSLVSKEPPALVEGPRGTGHDQGQKTGPTVRWDIPNVLVKDVPNFELLSPELEAGTAPSHSPRWPAWSYLPSPYQMSSVAGVFFFSVSSTLNCNLFHQWGN